MSLGSFPAPLFCEIFILSVIQTGFLILKVSSSLKGTDLLFGFVLFFFFFNCNSEIFPNYCKFLVSKSYLMTVIKSSKLSDRTYLILSFFYPEKQCQENVH